MVIDFNSLEELRGYISVQGNRMTQALQSCLTVMQSVRDAGILCGETAEAFCLFLREAGFLPETVREFAEQTETLLREFVAEIERTDRYEM